MKKQSKILIWLPLFLLIAAVAGFAIQEILIYLPVIAKGGSMKLDPSLFLSWRTWAYGGVAFAVMALIWLLSGNNLELLLHGDAGKGLLEKRD